MYGFTRKSDSGTTLGISSWGVIFVVTMLATYFILSKQRAAPTQSTRQAIPKVEATKTVEGLQSFTSIRVTPGLSTSNVIQKAQPANSPMQGLLDSKGLSITDAPKQVDMSALAALGTGSRSTTGVIVEDFSTLKLVKADDGKEYLRSRSGAFSPIIVDGLKLSSEDGKLTYTIQEGNLILEDGLQKIKLVDKPNHLLKDLDGRFYGFAVNGKLTLKTPGSSSDVAFKGPDGNEYKIGPKGALFQLTNAVTNRGIPIEFLPGEGEFKGNDGKLYLISDGIYYVVQPNVSFVASKLLGRGFFKGPSGAATYKGADSLLYSADMRRTINLTGTGTFTGPDGTIYNYDGKLLNVVSQYKTSGSSATTTCTDDEVIGDTGPSGLLANVNVEDNLIPLAAQGKDGEFDPDKAVSSLKGGVVYVSTSSAEAKKIELAKAAAAAIKKQSEKPVNFLPIGHRVPFFLTTKINDNFKKSVLVSGMVAENTYFHNTCLPAGTKLYGRAGKVEKNHRMDISWNTLVFPDGSKLPIVGDVFDVNLNPGIEAYYTPLPLWTYLYKFGHIAMLVKINEEVSKSVKAPSTGGIMSDPSSQAAAQAQVQAQQKQIDNIEKSIVEVLEEIKSGILDQVAAYHTLPAGQPGIIILTNDLNLSTRAFTTQEVAKPSNLLGDGTVPPVVGAPSPTGMPDLKELGGLMKDMMGNMPKTPDIKEIMSSMNANNPTNTKNSSTIKDTPTTSATTIEDPKSTDELFTK